MPLLFIVKVSLDQGNVFHSNIACNLTHDAENCDLFFILVSLPYNVVEANRLFMK